MEARKKSAKSRKRRSKTSEFVQDFLPVREIRNGIIETTDDRYVKIIEILPINFLLRSSEEQYNIISSFASWLKISPMRLQFKSVSRKADSDKHVAMVREELSRENDPQCRQLGEEYLRLIKDVGNKEALSRRFFLIFQYEPPAGKRNSGESYADIYSMIQTAVQNAKTYFMQCGNAIVQPEDEDVFTAEVLYMFFNRSSCCNEPFQSRVERVVVDTMQAKGKIIGLDAVPHIRPANFIAPRGIDFSHYNFVVMDGMYYSVMYIRRNGFPHSVRGGWMSSLINAGEGIDVDVFLRRENRGKTLDKVAQRIRLNRTKLRGMQDTSTDYEELTGSIQSGYYIKSGIANNNEDLFYMSVLITISARTYEELLWRRGQMTDLLKSMDMYVNDCNFQHEAALRSVMPFLCIDPNIEKKAQRNILTSGAASTYMLGCSDDVTATYISTRSGDMTIDVNSTMTTRQTFAVAQVIPQYRYSEGIGKRRLLTPDEVLRLPQEDMLVAVRGQKMLRLRKLDYTRLPAAKQLRPCSILDYGSGFYSEPMHMMLLIIGCARAPQAQSTLPTPEPTVESSESCLDPQNAGAGIPNDASSVEPTPESAGNALPMVPNTAPSTPTVEPTLEKPEDETPWTQNTARPAPTVKPTSKPPQTLPSSTPSAALEITVPTLAPQATPKPTAKPTGKPGQQPMPMQPTEPPAAAMEEPPAQPGKTESPTAEYTDATHLCAAFLEAINIEKAANSAPSGSLDASLCSIAQDRARQMAAACTASHIGSGYPETVGAMGSEGGTTNRGRNAVHHSPQLMDCTRFGIGVAIGRDGMYYYSIIGE